MERPQQQQLTIAYVCVSLVVLTALCYWPVTGNGFVNFDDNDYIYQNAQVSSGLTWPGVIWAFTTGHASNWHPLTWISHMLDCQLYGLNPSGHHATNLLFHIANSLLVFFFLKMATGSTWRSAIVAALFAWHPLHVESVAWASERKDVLSTFFGLLSLICYVRYAQQKTTGDDPTGDDRSRSATVWLRWALVLFVFGLMSKPMLVTLPFVLVLLDFWPLRRFTLSEVFRSSPPANGAAPAPKRIWGLLAEKWSFFAFSLTASIVTWAVQKNAGSVASFDALPLPLRVGNAVLAYLGYLANAIWPTNLAIFYPHPERLVLSQVLPGACLLVLIGVLAFLRHRATPWVGVGWFWFVGTLVPTIGLVQVGSQAMADRYMYIPSIGLFLAAVWGIALLRDALKIPRPVLAPIALVPLAACVLATRSQVAHWLNGETLFRHAISVTSGNYLAYNCLGGAFQQNGKHTEALAAYAESVRLNPHLSVSQYNYGTLLSQQGRHHEAASHLRAALRCKPDYAAAHINLGQVLMSLGDLAGAQRHFSKAAQLTPQDPEAHFNLGTVCLQQADYAGAVRSFSDALRQKPGYAAAHGNLGVALMRSGKPLEGLQHLHEAMRLEPTNAQPAYNFGVALLEVNQDEGAVRAFEAALKIRPDHTQALYHLALACSRLGRTQEALSLAERAHEIAHRSGLLQEASRAHELADLCRQKAQMVAIPPSQP